MRYRAVQPKIHHVSRARHGARFVGSQVDGKLSHFSRLN